MLYTRKGDDGTTKVIGSTDRFSKGSLITHAIGTLDETNSFLGLCRAKAGDFLIEIAEEKIRLNDLILEVQNDLFIIQAKLAGAPKKIVPEKIKRMEKIIDGIESILPPIKSFLIPGETELGALLDIARTVVRRAERQMLKAREGKMAEFSDETLTYINRLSSLCYALARLASTKGGIKEKSPDYR